MQFGNYGKFIKKQNEKVIVFKIIFYLKFGDKGRLILIYC